MIDSPAYRNLNREFLIQQSIDRETKLLRRISHIFMPILLFLVAILIVGIFVRSTYFPGYTIPLFIDVPYFICLLGTAIWCLVTLSKIGKEIKLRNKHKSEMETWIITD